MTKILCAVVATLCMGCCTVVTPGGMRTFVSRYYEQCATEAIREDNSFKKYRCWDEAKALCKAANLESDCGYFIDSGMR